MNTATIIKDLRNRAGNTGRSARTLADLVERVRKFRFNNEKTISTSFGHM